MDDPTFRVTPLDSLTLRRRWANSTWPRLRSPGRPAVAAERWVSTFDLSELAFLDSSGLNEFARYARSLNGRGRLSLQTFLIRIANLLELVGFDQLKTIEIR